jgi:hypothetical protein
MSWHKVAREMLAGRELGSQVSRAEAWMRACKEIERLRHEIDRCVCDCHDAVKE